MTVMLDSKAAGTQTMTERTRSLLTLKNVHIAGVVLLAGVCLLAGTAALALRHAGAAGVDQADRDCADLAGKPLFAERRSRARSKSGGVQDVRTSRRFNTPSPWP